MPLTDEEKKEAEEKEAARVKADAKKAKESQDELDKLKGHAKELQDKLDAAGKKGEIPAASESTMHAVKERLDEVNARIKELGGKKARRWAPW